MFMASRKPRATAGPRPPDPLRGFQAVNAMLTASGSTLITY